MTESLVVDPARLKAAGVTLRDQILPAPPSPTVATGADSVSSAINETLPILESPVVIALPETQAALTNTGSKIVTAAEMYAETDQLLGEHVGAVQFLGALSGAEATDKTSGGTVGQKIDRTPSSALPTNLNQLSAMTQAAQPVTQGLQTVMSSVQQASGGMGSAGAAPAKLADDTKKGDDTEDPDEKQTAQSALQL